MSDPKPCPFCGSNNVKVYDAHQAKFRQYNIKCKKCGARICKATPADAIEAWNRRAMSAELRSSEEALRSERTAKVTGIHDEYSFEGICYLTYGKCGHCQGEVAYKDNYCTSCGARLEWE